MLFALQQSLLMFTPSLLTVYKETRDFNKLIAISCPVRTVRLDAGHSHTRLRGQMTESIHIFFDAFLLNSGLCSKRDFSP